MVGDRNDRYETLSGTNNHVAMTDFPFSGMARMATGATRLGCPTSR
jgi:hypothetical protein